MSGKNMFSQPVSMGNSPAPAMPNSPFGLSTPVMDFRSPQEHAEQLVHRRLMPDLTIEEPESEMRTRGLLGRSEAPRLKEVQETHERKRQMEVEELQQGFEAAEVRGGRRGAERREIRMEASRSPFPPSSFTQRADDEGTCPPASYWDRHLGPDARTGFENSVNGIEEALHAAQDVDREIREAVAREAEEGQHATDEAERKAKEKADRIARAKADRCARQAAAGDAALERQRAAKEEEARNAAEAKCAQIAEGKAREAQMRAKLAKKRALEAKTRAAEDAKREADVAMRQAAWWDSKPGVLRRARDAAKKQAGTHGTINVAVSMCYRGQTWIREFMLELGSIILDLKLQMVPAAPEEADWFELQRAGTRLSDLARVPADGGCLTFAFLGPLEGGRLAGIDIELALKEQQAVVQSRAAQVEVLVKEKVGDERKERMITLSIDAGSRDEPRDVCGVDVRRAVAGSLGRELSRVRLFLGSCQESASAATAVVDSEAIGACRRFIASCDPGDADKAPITNQTTEDLKLFAWNEAWHSANISYADLVPKDKRASYTDKAAENAKLSKAHSDAIVASGAVASRILRLIRLQAAHVGVLAAEAAMEGRPLDVTALPILEAPRDIDAELGTLLAKAVNTAAGVIALMAQDAPSHKSVALQIGLNLAWKKFAARLLGGAPQKS